ncbi:hypothetical protein C8F01DRAFT_1131915 [Mycena amicta]|nr:hypothetical protein C8F01DRAFT_1131915 [Mycena amicta]
MRPNNVALLRLLLLSLQAHLHLLVLVAAGWNVAATRASGAPAATVLLILTSVLFMTLASIGGVVAFFKLPFAFLVSIRFECGWTLALVVVQLGATIGLTAISPPPGMVPAVFASHSLLIPAAWLATSISALYVFGILVIVRAHSVIFPEIWSASAYSVEWFSHTEIDANLLDNDSWTRHLNDIEAEGQTKQPFNLCTAAFNEKAPWAQEIRRGVDDPFASRPDVPRSPTPSSNFDAALPPLPLRVKTKTAAMGSRFIEPIDDHDKPIPVPKDVKWVPANAQAQ